MYECYSVVQSYSIWRKKKKAPSLRGCILRALFQMPCSDNSERCKRKKKQTTWATINNKMNGQSPLKLRTRHWYHPSQVALWDPQHQGPLSIISHSIFKPTSSQPNASSNRPRVLESASLTWPPRALTRKASLMRGLGSPLSILVASTGADLPVPNIYHMAIWSLPLINHPE